MRIHSIGCHSHAAHNPPSIVPLGKGADADNTHPCLRRRRAAIHLTSANFLATAALRTFVKACTIADALPTNQTAYKHDHNVGLA